MRKGSKMTDEQKAKISRALAGRPKPDDVREKIRLGMIRYRAVEKALRERDRAHAPNAPSVGGGVRPSR